MAHPQDNGGRDDGRSEKSLRLSIKNRTKGLCKKAYELAILCDVELALVCYPSDADEPITWPPDRSKIEDAIHHYFEIPAHKKLPKNQITLDNPNPNSGADKNNAVPNSGADKNNNAVKAAVSKAPETDHLCIPFHDDEEKLIALRGILASRLEAVRKMIAVRRTEGRRDPRPSARATGKKLAVAAANASVGDSTPSAGETGKKLAQGQGGPLPPVEAVTAGSASREDLRTSDRDGGKRVAREDDPVWGWGNPDFSATPEAAGRRGGGAPDSCYPCPCCYCPVHGHLFTRWNAR